MQNFLRVKFNLVCPLVSVLRLKTPVAYRHDDVYMWCIQASWCVYVVQAGVYMWCNPPCNDIPASVLLQKLSSMLQQLPGKWRHRSS